MTDAGRIGPRPRTDQTAGPERRPPADPKLKPAQVRVRTAPAVDPPRRLNVTQPQPRQLPRDPPAETDNSPQAQRAREQQAKLDTRAADLARAGLEVNVSVAALQPPARTRRDMGVDELARLVYETDRPSAREIALLRQQNPALTGDRVPENTEVNFRSTPLALGLAREHLQLSQARIDGMPLGPERDLQTATVTAALADVRVRGEANWLAMRLESANTTADALLRERRVDAIPATYAAVRSELNARVGAGNLTADEAGRLGTSVDALEAQRLSTAMSQLGSHFVSQVQTSVNRTQLPDPGGLGWGVAYHAQAADKYARENREPTLQAVENTARIAAERLRAIANANPDQRPWAEAQLANLDTERRRTVAGVHLAANDPAAAERALLPAALTQSGDQLLRPDTTRRVAPDGRELTGISGFFSSGTAVPEMSPERRDAMVRRIGELPQAERRAAMAGLLELADLHAARNDGGRFRAAQQILGELTRANVDPELGVRTRFVDARFHSRVRNFEAARQSLDAAIADARRLGGDAGQRLVTEATVGLMATHRAEAFAGTTEETRFRAAERLTDLRRQLENDPRGFSREQVGRLAVLEAQTYLQQGRTDLAEHVFKYTDALFRDAPQAHAAAAALREESQRTGFVAAMQQVIHSAGNAPPELALSYTFGLGLAGAGIGYVFGNAPGAAGGFIAGSGLGALTAAAHSAYRSWDQVSQAYRTGLSPFSLQDTLTDSAFLGLNLASSVAPLGGLARVSQLTNVGALVRQPTELVRELERSVGLLGQTATRQEIEAEARRLVAQAFAEGTMSFGGRPFAIAGATAITAPIATELVRIQGMEPGPERDAAMASFSGHLLTSTLLTATTLATAAYAARLARGSPRWQMKGGDDAPFSALPREAPDPVPGDLNGAAVRQEAYAQMERLLETSRGRMLTSEETGRIGALVEQSALDLTADRRRQLVESTIAELHARRVVELELATNPHITPDNVAQVIERMSQRIETAAPGTQHAFGLAAQAFLDIRGGQAPALRSALFDRITTNEIAAALPPRLAPNVRGITNVLADELARMRGVASGERAATRAQVDQARAAIADRLRELGVTADESNGLIGTLQREAFQRGAAERLAREQQARQTPMSETDIRRVTDEVADRVGLGRDAEVVADLGRAQGFGNWVRSHLSVERWTPEMRRDAFLSQAGSDVRAEMGRLTPAEFDAVFGSRPAPWTAEIIGDIPGFSDFARRNPQGARDVFQVMGMWSDVRNRINTQGWDAVATEARALVPTVEPTGIPNHVLMRRQPGAPDWVPEFAVVPTLASDHNSAGHYHATMPPGWFGGYRSGPSIFSSMGASATPRQVIINGQALTNFDRTLMLHGHGWHGGPAGVSPTRAARAMADTIASLPADRRPLNVVLVSCFQTDRRGLVFGRSSGAIFRAQLNRELANRGLPPVAVATAERPGVTMSGVAWYGVPSSVSQYEGFVRYDPERGWRVGPRQVSETRLRDDVTSRANVPPELLYFSAGMAALWTGTFYGAQWYFDRR